MPQFKKILCAVSLAKERKAMLRLLHVVAVPPGPEVALPFGRMEATARTKLERLARQRIDGKARYEVDIMMGDPGVEVLQAAKR